MLRSIGILGLLVLAGCASQPENSAPSQSAPSTPPTESTAAKTDRHPILGLWEYTENGCTETYQFLSNGSRKGTSGNEIIEATYTISATPLPNGFYLLTDRVIRDLGGAGCSGSDVDLTGSVTKVLVRFSANFQQLTFCSIQNSSQCFGPLIKQQIRIP